MFKYGDNQKNLFLKDFEILDMFFIYNDLSKDDQKDVIQFMLEKTIYSKNYDNSSFLFTGWNNSKFDNFPLMEYVVKNDLLSSFKMQNNAITTL